MKNKRGFITPLLVGMIVLLIIEGGAYLYFKNKGPAQIIVNTEVSSTSTSTQNQVPSNWNTYNGYGISFEYPASMGNPVINQQNTETQIGFGDMSVSFRIGTYYDQNMGRVRTFDEVVNDVLNNQNVLNLQKTNMIVDGKNGVKITYTDSVSGGGTTYIFVPSGDSKGDILIAYEYSRGASNLGLTAGLEQILPTLRFIGSTQNQTSPNH